jgi:hypothetical protein
MSKEPLKLLTLYTRKTLKMTTKTFTLDPEQADIIVISELKAAYCDLVICYDHPTSVFSTDVDEDRKLIKKHLDALELILKYYGVEVYE